MAEKSIILYTCNFGNYDTFKEPIFSSGIVSYIMFTDIPQLSKVWNVKKVDWSSITNDPQKAARYFKINSHLLLPPHKISIWIDSSFGVNIKDFNKFIETHLGQADLGCHKHGREGRFARGCLYEEAEVCRKARLDSATVIDAQIDRYRKEGFPEGYGLNSTGLLVRRNCLKTNQFNEIWWNEVRMGSKRDQLSQMYAIWKSGINTHVIESPSIYANPNFIKVSHNWKLRARKLRKDNTKPIIRR